MKVAVLTDKQVLLKDTLNETLSITLDEFDKDFEVYASNYFDKEVTSNRFDFMCNLGFIYDKEDNLKGIEFEDLYTRISYKILEDDGTDILKMKANDGIVDNLRIRWFNNIKSY